MTSCPHMIVVNALRYTTATVSRENDANCIQSLLVLRWHCVPGLTWRYAADGRLPTCQSYAIVHARAKQNSSGSTPVIEIFHLILNIYSFKGIKSSMSIHFIPFVPLRNVLSESISVRKFENFTGYTHAGPITPSQSCREACS